VDNGYGGLTDGVEDSAKKVSTLTTVVGPTASESIETMLLGFEDLAESLGADVTSCDGAAAKQDFEAAKDRLKRIVSEKKGLPALAVSPRGDRLYVADTERAAELVDFSDWGLDVTVPGAPDPGFRYWEIVSWEHADKFQPDLILFDDRTYDASLKAA